jgi:hypothetical protein
LPRSDDGVRSGLGTGVRPQADADFEQFQHLQSRPDAPECHRLQFLQMACEKLAKAHLCGGGADPAVVRTSHAYVEKTLPVVLRELMVRLRYPSNKARELLRFVRQMAGEIELLTPSPDRDGRRPDNCEYSWEDRAGTLHSPLDWSFVPAQLLLMANGRTFLKLLRAAIRDRLG